MVMSMVPSKYNFPNVQGIITHDLMKLIFHFFLRYNVIDYNKSFIHAKLAVGPYVGKPNSDIMIPRIKFLPTDDRKIPFEWQRFQFPVRLCFGITSNR